jgi:hypothetical protein
LRIPLCHLFWGCQRNVNEPTYLPTIYSAQFFFFFSTTNVILC